MKPGKKNSKVCGRKSHLRLRKYKKLPQTCGFEVADNPLLFCGIRGCGIACKFAVPSTVHQIGKKVEFLLEAFGERMRF